MNTTTVQTSKVSSHDLYWEHKMEKRKRSTIITLSGKVSDSFESMSLSRAQTIFMPSNINSIVILERILLAWWVGIKKWTRNYGRSAKLLSVDVLAVVDVFRAPYSAKLWGDISWWGPLSAFCSILRESCAFSCYQNSFRAQPPSQVRGHCWAANKDREEQQRWRKIQQGAQEQKMTSIY